MRKGGAGWWARCQLARREEFGGGTDGVLRLELGPDTARVVPSLRQGVTTLVRREGDGLWVLQRLCQTRDVGHTV